MAGPQPVHPRKASLRAPSGPTLAIVPAATTPQPKISALQAKEDQMHELALELGFFCTRSSSYKVDLATRIASSLRNRSGSAVYQSVAISISHIPLEFCFQTFALATQELPTSGGTTTWTMATMDQTMQVFGSIFQAADLSCSGASKALKSPSEKL